jgi:hypothetical protein
MRATSSPGWGIAGSLAQPWLLAAMRDGGEIAFSPRQSSISGTRWARAASGARPSFLAKRLRMMEEPGCPARIRTSIDGIRIRSLTIRRRGNRRVPLGAVPIPVKRSSCPFATRPLASCQVPVAIGGKDDNECIDHGGSISAGSAR